MAVTSKTVYVLVHRHHSHGRSLSFRYSNLFSVFLSILRNEGVTALYRGALLSLIGVLPYSGCVFFTYESLKHIRMGKSESTIVAPAMFISSEDHNAHRPINKAERMLFGATAGLVGQTASYPFDVIRRRLQTAAVIRPKEASFGAIATATKIIREEGILRGLYKGVTMNWLKGPISVGISFVTFDTLVRLIRGSPVFIQK
jgi:solute carrier family 25, member 42